MSKRYSEEFKRGAVARVLAGEPPGLVASECGATAKSVRNWVRAADASSSERPTSSAELDEIRRLRRELVRSKRDNEILKKALGLLAGEPK